MPSRFERRTGLEIEAEMGLEHQRVKEQHAELPIGAPMLSGLAGLEGGDIDEDGLRADKLDVERRRILDRPPSLNPALQQIELQQGSILQHGEGPFIGLGDQGHSFMRQNARPALGHDAFDRLISRIRRSGPDDEAALHVYLEEAGLLERLEVLERSARHAAKDPPIMLVDTVGRIAERACIRERNVHH
jgi:hypothetical protein